MDTYTCRACGWKGTETQLLLSQSRKTEYAIGTPDELKRMADEIQRHGDLVCRCPHCKGMQFIKHLAENSPIEKRFQL